MIRKEREEGEEATTPQEKKLKTDAPPLVVRTKGDSDVKKELPVFYSRVVAPDTFVNENHYYPRVLNASVHPMVASFMRLGNERIAARYCHMNPRVSEKKLLELLNYKPKYFRWAGSDLFNVTDHTGHRVACIIETNSCPSGQKSFPPLHESSDDDDMAGIDRSGYHKLMRTTFKPMLDERKDLPEGGLAVIFDKNEVEASGYAAAMADVFNEQVYLTEYYVEDENPPVKFIDGVLHVRPTADKWVPIRAAFRYVTNRPWCHIPLNTKTAILNPVVACLAGGRNKMAADKAYDLFNMEIAATGLQIRTPATRRDVSKDEIPLYVETMGGKAVVKVPYSNAGQGVYTIVNQQELQAFMSSKTRYDKFIVQSLIGNAKWATTTPAKPGQFFHIGTIPNRKKETYVSDLRVMVSASPGGYQPLAIYARKAFKPLAHEIKSGEDSWSMLGTNLSVKMSDGKWSTETQRLLLMDVKDFNKLGIGLDDLIDAYVQTVLSVTAIDRMAQRLCSQAGKFDLGAFRSLNDDHALLAELRMD